MVLSFSSSISLCSVHLLMEIIRRERCLFCQPKIVFFLLVQMSLDWVYGACLGRVGEVTRRVSQSKTRPQVHDNAVGDRATALFLRCSSSKLTLLWKRLCVCELCSSDNLGRICLFTDVGPDDLSAAVLLRCSDNGVNLEEFAVKYNGLQG